MLGQTLILTYKRICNVYIIIICLFQSKSIQQEKVDKLMEHISNSPIDRFKGFCKVMGENRQTNIISLVNKAIEKTSCSEDVKAHLRVHYIIRTEKSLRWNSEIQTFRVEFPSVPPLICVTWSSKPATVQVMITQIISQTSLINGLHAFADKCLYLPKCGFSMAMCDNIWKCPWHVFTCAH